MTNQDYKNQIEQWTGMINGKGITLSNGQLVPTVFWKTFLGISRTVHIEIMNDTYRRKEFSASLSQTIRFAQALTVEAFEQEVLRSIPIYEANKRK